MKSFISQKIITLFVFICLFATKVISQRTLILPKSINKIFPEKTGGDNDFYGHGPKVSGNVQVKISDDRAQLIAIVSMKLEETEGDKTSAEIKNEPRTIYSAPPGKQIKSVASPSSLMSSFEFVVQGQGLKRQNTGRTGPVSHLIINGDTRGPDLGNLTDEESHVSVFFNGMVVDLEPLPAGTGEISIAKNILGGVLNGKLSGTTGRINTYGPRIGDSWFKPNDCWLQFPSDIRSGRMMLSGMEEIRFEGRRYYYNDINLTRISARGSDEYMLLSITWDSDGAEARGECVDNATCILGTPSVQLNDFIIRIKLRPVIEGGMLKYDKTDLQVDFNYNFNADCGVISFLCTETFKSFISSAFFNARYLIANALREEGTRNEISMALNSGILTHIRTIGGTPSASRIIAVADAGNNLLIRYR